MKTTLTLTLIFACMVAMSAHGQESIAHTHYYTPNELLSKDVVELAFYEEVNPGDFFSQRPVERPTDIPPAFVLVWVYQAQEDGSMRFVGWEYMDAEVVNELHSRKVVEL
jgi:hypothetical protein